MGMTIRQFPERDRGTGEHSQAEEPIVTNADDVDNQPVGDAADMPAETTYTADDVDNEPDEASEDAGPVTYTTDWPNVDDKVVKEADTKTAADKPAQSKPASSRRGKRS